MSQDWFSSCYYCFASIKHIIFNLFIVFIIVGIITATIYADTPYDEVNLTREPVFERDRLYDYIRRIAEVESKDGLDDSTYRNGYHGGLWQVNEPNFMFTQEHTCYLVLTDKYKLVNDKFDIDWLTLQWRELRKPLWSGVAACLYMCAVGGKIPSSISKQA